MLELGMILSLALMGIYFYKSADLPKEMKDRSAQLQAQKGEQQAFKPKMTFPKVEIKTNSSAIQGNDLDAKLSAMKQQKKIKDIALLNAEIDRLTFEITTLEQQIKDNNARNAEIQKTIDAHLITLQELQAQITLLT